MKLYLGSVFYLLILSNIGFSLDHCDSDLKCKKNPKVSEAMSSEIDTQKLIVAVKDGRHLFMSIDDYLSNYDLDEDKIYLSDDSVLSYLDHSFEKLWKMVLKTSSRSKKSLLVYKDKLSSFRFEKNLYHSLEGDQDADTLAHLLILVGMQQMIPDAVMNLLWLDIRTQDQLGLGLCDVFFNFENPLENLSIVSENELRSSIEDRFYQNGRGSLEAVLEQLVCQYGLNVKDPQQSVYEFYEQRRGMLKRNIVDIDVLSLTQLYNRGIIRSQLFRVVTDYLIFVNKITNYVNFNDVGHLNAVRALKTQIKIMIPADKIRSVLDELPKLS